MAEDFFTFVVETTETFTLLRVNKYIISFRKIELKAKLKKNGEILLKYDMQSHKENIN